MTRPISIQQPGPALEPRIVAVNARGQAIRFEMAAGVKLLGGIQRGFNAAGFESGVVELGALALSPFAYVMPALPKDSRNAAFYSEVFRPAGLTRLDAGALTFGRRDGAPFFHAHALWREADGKTCGGHILPEDTVLAEATTVDGFGLKGCCFDAAHDPETNLTVFGPIERQTTISTQPTRAIAIRLRPNQDIVGALEVIAAQFGIRRARVRGGVGSTIGAAMVDGTIVENFATEVFVQAGAIAPSADGGLAVTLDVGLIDHTGQTARGRLLNGHNPVLMTFELVLEVIEP